MAVSLGGLALSATRVENRYASGPIFFLQRNTHAADRVAVQPGAGHLDEVTLLLAVDRLHPGQGEIDGSRLAKLDRLPSALGGERDAQFAGEHIHRAERQDAELHLAKPVAFLGQAVDNLVDRAVAAGGDDGFVAVADGLCGEGSRASGRGRLEQRALVLQLAKRLAKAPGFFAAGGGIEN